MKKIVVIGGMNIDILATADPLHFNDSSIGSIQTAFGGVGRNIAENIARLGLEVSLCSVIGDDNFGTMVLEHAKSIGINTSLIQTIKSSRTGSYLAVSDNQDMVVGINDMDISSHMDIEWAKNYLDTLRTFDLLVLEANLPLQTLQFLCESLQEKQIIIDPVSAVKAPRLMDSLSFIDTLKCNSLELRALTNESVIANAITKLLAIGVKRVIVTQGKDDIIDATNDYQYHYTPKLTTIVNVTGAGDAFSAGIASGMALGLSQDQQITLAMKMSEITIQSVSTVSDQITPDLLKEII